MPKEDDQWILFFGAGFIVKPSKGLGTKEVEKELKGSRVEVDSLPKDFFASLFNKPATNYPIEIAFVSEGESVHDTHTSEFLGWRRSSRP